VGKKVTIEYVDDLDGVPINAKSVDVVEFSYRGQEYTLDLTRKNGAQFDKDMARYIAAATNAQTPRAKSSGRRAESHADSTGATTPRSRRSPAAKTKSATPTNGTARNREIRDWAADNGHTVSPRGRIPAAVIDAFDAAQ
jgi:hypothetical protein